MTPEDLALLACPRCGSSLGEGESSLRCEGCGAAYAVRDRVPDLLPWSGGVPGPEWDLWREKLALLQKWRSDTWNGSSTAAALQKIADDHVAEFLRFAQVGEGSVVLEIGCGSGACSRHLPRRRYVGIDPLPLEVPASLPGSPAPVIVQGVGERLPLADTSVDAVLLCETIDHASDPRRVLREARRALKPGGVLAVLQSVAVPVPAPPLRVRLRVALGRLRARLSGRRPTTDAQTKMHVFTPDGLRALAASEFLVETARTEGQTLFLRARKQER